MAVKRVNRKRIELTREVLFELKHVMCGGREGGSGLGKNLGIRGGWPTEAAWRDHSVS